MHIYSDEISRLVYGSYRRAVHELQGLDADTRDISIAKRLLETLEINLNYRPTVTITGSKGKGSTSVLLASILSAAGYRVGLVTSPHLRSFRERIRIDGDCVSVDQLARAASSIAAPVARLTTALSPPRYLGPGGVILALAYEIFAESEVDVIVVEAGRGGEHDEARLVKADVSVLTPVMLEHPDKLGDSIAKIAETKARIAAPGAVIVSAPQTDEAARTISRVATELGCELRTLIPGSDVSNVVSDEKGIVCDLHLDRLCYPRINSRLPGSHQAYNLATAVLAGLSLRRSGIRIPEAAVYRGAEQVRWPGRLQKLQSCPWVLLDGAINFESAQHALDVCAKLPHRDIIAVLCVPQPKDIEGVCQQYRE